MLETHGHEVALLEDDNAEISGALGQLNGHNRENTFETGKSGHSTTIRVMEEMLETVKLAILASGCEFRSGYVWLAPPSSLFTVAA